MSTRMIKVAEKPKDTMKTLRRLSGYMSPIVISVTIGLAAVGTLMSVAAPKILGSATTLIYEAVKTGSHIDRKSFSIILLRAVLLYIIQFICTFLQMRFMLGMAQDTSAELRSSLKSKMNRASLSFFDKNANGNLMSIAVNDTDNVANSIQQSVGEMITNIITIAGMLIIMLIISWKLTLAAVIMVPLSAGIMGFFLPKSQKYMSDFLEKQGALNAQIEESYNGHSIIKCNNWEEHAVNVFDEINDKMIDSSWKAGFAGAFMMKNVLCFKNLVYVFIAVMGAFFVAGGEIAIGDMQAFLMYAVLFSSPITRLGLTFSEIITGISSAERVFEVLDAEEVPKPAGNYENKDKEFKVSFSHVRFGYDEKILMKDFSLNVYSGQMIAIVGHTGAGKTTLINLLEGFYEIGSGAIYVDGIDIRNMEKSYLRRKIAVVLQDTWLFSGTIYDNIKYGKENASEDEVIAAAKAAFADDFVRTLPQGYNTVLNENAGNISQGQRQLITIARAFIANPEILILDEATSSVDSRTEMLIQNAVKKLLAGRTSFVIAHRLSTIYNADNIIVMKDGDIAETGSHKSLVKEKGLYSDIYFSQFVSA